MPSCEEHAGLKVSEAVVAQSKMVHQEAHILIEIFDDSKQRPFFINFSAIVFKILDVLIYILVIFPAGE